MRVRFSSRLILSLILIEVLMLSLLAWNSGRLINQSHSDFLQKYVAEQSALLVLALQPGLAANDRALIQDALSLLYNHQQIVYVRVVNHQGHLMAARGEQSDGAPTNSAILHTQQRGIYNVKRPVSLYGQPLGTLYAGYATDYVAQLTTTTHRQNILFAVIVLLFTIGASVLLGWMLTRNLRKLEWGANALQRGELNHRIEIHSNDEIASVAQAFNQLAKRLQSSQYQLEMQNKQSTLEKRRIKILLDNVSAVITEADPSHMHFSYVCQQAEKLLALTLGEWLQPGFWERHIHPDDLDRVSSSLRSHAHTAEGYTIDYRMQHRNSEYIWVRHTLTFESVGDGRMLTRGLMVNINEQKVTEQRIMFLANHDSLTGMFNRRRFQEQLERQIAYSRRFQLSSALLFIDLDQFKFINDTLGHQAGDICLTSAAEVIKSSLREVDVVGRLGGDEFGVILPQVDANNAVHVAKHLIHSLQEKVKIPAEVNTRISASIGIALFPDQGTTPEELLAKADAAMYTIKRSGRGRIHVYQPDDQELLNMQAKVHWEDRIIRALKEDSFVLHYQPILHIQSKQIVHHEVLLRMRDEKGELIYPDAFLSTAERFGMIREVDQWVIRKAIEVQGNSIRSGQPVSLAMNLSGRHFGDPDFMALVQSAVKEYHADPSALMFEVTETAAVENLKTAKTFIEGLRNLGCRFALDDFGMGYSSFHYLKNLPVDIVKIDGSFIRNLHQNPSDQAIVKAIRDMTWGMNITIVAEFVENEQILQQLELMGIDYAQGYHIAMPTEHFIYTYDAQPTPLKVSPHA